MVLPFLLDVSGKANILICVVVGVRSPVCLRYGEFVVLKTTIFQVESLYTSAFLISESS